ncbi:MAG: M56 family metallopeptidase [Candidatus Sulfotelmatobacter sp.]
MIWPQVQAVAQVAIGRILNSLPEGLLITLFASMMLRFLPRQNSGTRFAVWFVALLAVVGLPMAALPFIGGIWGEHSILAAPDSGPLIVLSGPWGFLLLLAWVLAAGVALLRLGTGLWHLRELRLSCATVDVARLEPAVQKTIEDLGPSRSPFSRSVTLATSERISVPAAIGFFKPMIVIPAWALRDLPPDELNIILLHEFAHLHRWDDWTNLLQKIVRAVFLFHPAVWWIEKRLSLEREMACDDVVLAKTANPRGYAKCLVALLEKSFARRGWAMAQAAVHRAHEASLRLARILDVHRPETRYIWKPALGLVGAFSLVCLMVAPRAPQLVAFEQRAGAVHAGDVGSAVMLQPQVPATMVIPAAMHVSSSSSFAKAPRAHVVQAVEHLSQCLPGRRYARASARRRAAPRMVEAGWNAKTGHTSVDVETAAASRLVVPVPETLLLIRTTQRVGPNLWVWSVSIWRVTWANPAQLGLETAPSAKKT